MDTLTEVEQTADSTSPSFTATGVDSDVAYLQLLGETDPGLAQKVKEFEESEDVNYSQVISKIATRLSMSGGFLTDLTAQIKTNNETTQLLGIALRGVLPYAENEVLYLAGQFQKDGDENIREEYERGTERVTRAQQALNILNSSNLSIDNLPEDAFDDTFQITFEDDGEE